MQPRGPDQRKGRRGGGKAQRAGSFGGRTEGGVWEPCFFPLRLRLPLPLPKVSISLSRHRISVPVGCCCVGPPCTRPWIAPVCCSHAFLESVSSPCVLGLRNSGWYVSVFFAVKHLLGSWLCSLQLSISFWCRVVCAIGLGCNLHVPWGTQVD